MEGVGKVGIIFTDEGIGLSKGSSGGLSLKDEIGSKGRKWKRAMILGQVNCIQLGSEGSECGKRDVSVVVEVDAGCMFWERINRFKGLECYDVLRGTLIATVNKEELELICMILWSIWLNLNDSIHGGKTKSTEDLAFYWSSKTRTQMVLNSNSHSSPNICTVWQPPPPRCLKVHTDDAIRAYKGFIGVGVVIRDDSILIVAASSKILVGNIQAKMGELLALREGLLLAKILGCNVGRGGSL
ncbi:hypothetical protein EZV62_001067 [Acer yangbiense]|uniref:RNase H type-1 domain-containing protein n=1 Tax=Acer yangbiense TaxID=1000413 RepID=A0A5C7ITR3_9ROSI|nr:hypothetical protein EZV62_001067 [Acer yangbiense]